jgi:putative sterol carrier protein
MSKTKDFFDQTLPAKIAQGESAASSVGAIFLFNISGEGGGQWTVNLKDKVGITPGDAGNAECTLECSAADWEQIAANPQAAMQLFFEGKLKVSGNIMLATKLQQMLA